MMTSAHGYYAKIPHHASVAQLVEQGTENPRVSGSIPLRSTIIINKKVKYSEQFSKIKKLKNKF